MDEVKPGDTVCLRSDNGHLMSVTMTDSLTATCVWFDDKDSLCRATIPRVCLEIRNAEAHT